MKTYDPKLILWILKQFDKSFYGAQIMRDSSSSKNKVYKIWLKKKKFIELSCDYPKIYKVIHDGELYMAYLERLLKIPKKKRRIRKFRLKEKLGSMRLNLKIL